MSAGRGTSEILHSASLRSERQKGPPRLLRPDYIGPRKDMGVVTLGRGRGTPEILNCARRGFASFCCYSCGAIVIP